MIYRSGAAENSVIRDVELVTPVGNGIYFTGAGVREHIIISGVDMHHPAWSGIVFDDPDTSAQACSISDITIDEPGFGGTGARYGLDLAGVFTLANISVIHLDAAGPAVQTGLRFKERIAVSPDEQDARDCTLAGLIVTGSGANAVGLRMNGRHCAVVGGAIELEGVASIGVSVGGTLGSQFANGNKVAQVAVTAAIGYDETNTIARRNLLANCVMEECGVDVRLAAGEAHIIGNIFDGATVGSVLIQPSCLKPTIEDNRISNFTGVGIEVKALADGAFISGNRIQDGDAGIELEGTSVRSRVIGNMLRTLTGIGIEAKSGTLDSSIVNNFVYDATGVDYLNSATTAVEIIDNYPMDQELRFFKNNDNTYTGTTETDINDLFGLTFPTGDGGPDGAKVYEVLFHFAGEFDVVTSSTGRAHTIRLSLGANGDKADTTKTSFEVGPTTTSSIVTLVLDDTRVWAFRLTPTAGQKFGYSKVGTSAASMTFYGNAAYESDDEKSWVSVRRVRD